jgi:hypothetical protein
MRSSSLLGFLLAAPLVPGAAQVTGSFDAGSGTVQLGASSPTGVVSFAPALQLNSRIFVLDLRADYAEHSDRGWQTSGLVTSALRLPVPAPLSLELSGTAGWTRLSWGTAAAGSLGEARLLVAGAHRGLAFSAGLGRAFPDGPSQPFTRVEASGWNRIAGFDLAFSLRRTGLVVPGSSAGPRDAGNPPPIDTMEVNPGPSNGESTRRLHDHYTDINATVAWARRGLEIEAGVGRRFGKPESRYTSWRLQGLYWFTERLALVAATGQFPSDVVTGTPSGNYAMLSMRVSWQDRSPVAPSLVPLRPARITRAFATHRTGTGSVALDIFAPGATTVELMGSFTDWEPVTLASDRHGWWSAELPLGPGIYEVNYRVNGGSWQVPAGLTAVEDGFGSLVGVFSIED